MNAIIIVLAIVFFVGCIIAASVALACIIRLEQHECEIEELKRNQYNASEGAKILTARINELERTNLK